MSSYQLQSGNVTIYFQLADITNMKVDVIINFVDASHGTILRKGGTSVERQFKEKWSQSKQDFETVVITEGGNLQCKNIMHTTDVHSKPDCIGYFAAIKDKIYLCLQNEEIENFKTVAFLIPSGNIEDIILQSYFTTLSSYKSRCPKEIYCVFGDEDLFGKFESDYSKKVIPCERTSEGTPMPAVTSGPTDSSDSCSICLCDFTDQKTLDKCGHSFCSACIDHSFSVVGPNCPICQTVYGKVIGQQPPGTMRVEKGDYSLPGFPGCGMYTVYYDIPSGVQQKNHPNPGKRFSGTSRVAYLPVHKEGEIVLKMLQKAFLQKLIFTVGVSRTTNQKDTVTWNDIHHKTSMDGGPFQFGYPDPDYLKRVTLELEAKGVDAESVADMGVKNFLMSD